MASESGKRTLTVAAAQLGPIKSLDTPRSETLGRLIALLEQASEKKVNLVVFPELTFTTFYPAYIIDNPGDVAKFFEPASAEDPYAITNSPNGKPLIEKADELGIDISFGYGERWTGNDGKVVDYNTAVYYSASRKECIAKYRKIHLPGRYEPDTRPGVTQQLEKRYFTPGDLGFEAFRVPGLIDGALKAEDVGSASSIDTEGKGDPIMGMLICNDRRWAEGWRCYGLQGIELLLVSPRSEDKPPLSNFFFLTLFPVAGRLQYHSFCASVRRLQRVAGRRGTLPPPLVVPGRELPECLLQCTRGQGGHGGSRHAHCRQQHRRSQRPYRRRIQDKGR